MRSKRIAFGTYFVAISLASGLLLDLPPHGFMSIARAIDDIEAPVDDSPSDDEWIEVDLAEKIRILETLVSQMSANYDKIETWSGSYLQHFETGYGPEMRGKPGVPSSTNVHATFDSICRFAVDVKSNRCYLSVEEGKQSYENLNTHQPIKDHPSRILSERCILTPEHFVEFRPDQTLSNLINLREHKLPPKRVAFVRPPEESQLSLSGDFVDPRLLFHLATNRKAWQEYDSFLAAFRGKHGDAVRDRLDKKLAVSTATKNGEDWYRARWQDPNVGRFKERIHRSSVGFNMVKQVSGPEKSPSHILQWQYKLIDDIYVPSQVIVQHDNLQALRTLELRECELNQPIPASQFSYSALGLGEDDLIMNNIEKIAYLFKSGEPVKLSAYGEPPAADKPASLQPAP